ncbi:hypothetical protein CNYM01_01900 [Colletotrichum nymphaeae SA-01]|uniref:Uncharacterized protein n=1 Tax=Colletotrichum nymphaeae SA-01 TaxID=1460502 RepID=A0A135TYF9_9PEZI|nr:hypothetical protein CNYM01_01900 [Colletotrichum nymphaeae SA-01]
MAEGLKPGVYLSDPMSHIFIDGKYWVAKDLTLANFGDLVAAEKPEYGSTTAVQAANRPTVDEPKPHVERKIWDGDNASEIKEEDDYFMAAAMADEDNDEGPIGNPEPHTNHAPLAPMTPWHPSSIQEPEVHQNDRVVEAVNNYIIAGQQLQILFGLDDNPFDEYTPHH